jgi:hypothetical protein
MPRKINQLLAGKPPKVKETVFGYQTKSANNRFVGMREVIYKYHRLGLDVLSH